MVPTSVSHADREVARLEALRRYRILDTPPEREFDQLVQQAVRECGYPTALITLMDEHRSWFKATFGISAGGRHLRELPREKTFCNHAFQSSGIFVVPDARADKRFRGLPGVVRDGGYRAYMGAQLITPDGHSIGTLCLLDHAPRVPTQEQKDRLHMLAARVMALLDSRLRENAPAPSIALSPPSAALAEGTQELVLIVDDEEPIRGLMAKMLQRLGHEVRVAENGRAALDCIAAEVDRVRVVVTDIHMPVMNGVELVEQLSQQANPPATIAMSGKFTDSIRTQLRAAGVSAMLAKPFTMADLARTIDQAVAGVR